MAALPIVGGDPSQPPGETRVAPGEGEDADGAGTDAQKRCVCDVRTSFPPFN